MSREKFELVTVGYTSIEGNTIKMTQDYHTEYDFGHITYAITDMMGNLICIHKSIGAPTQGRIAIKREDVEDNFLSAEHNLDNFEILRRRIDKGLPQPKIHFNPRMLYQNQVMSGE